jgi:hypothetical protein
MSRVKKKEKSFMKIVVALVALGLLQACVALPSGKKLDQGGRYMQGSLGGTIFIQVDYPTAQLCSNELRATTMKDTDITCNLASAESTLPNKGSTTDKVIGIKYPMHFKTDQTCGFYKTALEGITDKAAIACNQ